MKETKIRETKIRWSLSAMTDVEFSLEGVRFHAKHAPYFLTHAELMNLNNLRKKYNDMCKDELLQQRAEGEM
jgi:hypothetical protein